MVERDDNVTENRSKKDVGEQSRQVGPPVDHLSPEGGTHYFNVETEQVVTPNLSLSTQQTETRQHENPATRPTRGVLVLAQTHVANTQQDGIVCVYSVLSARDHNDTGISELVAN